MNSKDITINNIESVDFEMLSAALNDVGVYGSATLMIDGTAHTIDFMVTPGNVYTSETLEENTPIKVWVCDADGNGDFPKLPEAIKEQQDEIEDALARAPEVRKAIIDVARARDELLEMEGEE